MAEGSGLIMISACDLAKIANAVITDHFSSNFTSEQRYVAEYEVQK